MMEDKYAECHRNVEGKFDGCQQFKKRSTDEFKCDICYCHRNFHRKVELTVVVYTKCHKIHDFKSQISVDGCQEFTPAAGKRGTLAELTCAICGCHRGFHGKEIMTTEVGSTY